MKRTRLFFAAIFAAGAVAFTACDDDEKKVRIHDVNTAAEVEGIDRFSPTAGHLQVRTPGNGLPAAGAAVNFDQAPFITKGLGPEGQLVEYYNFDVQPLMPAPIWVLFREGETSPVAGQLNIIDVIPGESNYNDFWQVVKVTVPKNYQANEVASYEEIVERQYPTTSTNMLVNCPVVPKGSTASKRLTNEPAGLIKGWYNEKIVYYFSFTEKNLVTSGGNVPVSPIYVSFTNDDPTLGFASEDNTATGQTHNVIATIPANPAYSPLWDVKAYPFTSFADVHNAAQAVQFAAPESLGFVNCPVVKLTN